MQRMQRRNCVSVLLGEEDDRKLRLIVKYEGGSRSALIRGLVQSYLRQWESERPDEATELYGWNGGE